MSYFMLGRDPQKKDAKLAQIRNKVFKDPSALAFDYETISAHKLESDDLKKALVALPHMAAQRMVVIRQCERLSEHNRELVLDALAEKSRTLLLVLDFDEVDPKSAFFVKLKSLTQALVYDADRSINVWDMTRLISARDAAGALKMLHQLMDNNTHPLQIMGGLVWYWGDERERMDFKRFQQGLAILEKGDLNIKRSRLTPEQALEKVVVELALVLGM